jgi:hypothetical protein
MACVSIAQVGSRFTEWKEAIVCLNTLLRNIPGRTDVNQERRLPSTGRQHCIYWIKWTSKHYTAMIFNARTRKGAVLKVPSGMTTKWLEHNILLRVKLMQRLPQTHNYLQWRRLLLPRKPRAPQGRS